MVLADIKAIGLDRDGTVLDNMIQRAEAFAEAVIQYYPGLASEKDAIIISVLQTRGVCRFDHLEFLINKYGLPALLEEQKIAWSQLFEEFYRVKPVDIFAEVVPVLQRLKGDYHLFLSTSATDGMHPKHLKILGPLFRNGNQSFMFENKPGFKKGRDHFEYVAGELGIALEQMAFIGDSPLDIRLANECGLYSVGIIDNRYGDDAKEVMLAENPRLYIYSLDELFREGF